jgi:hypothetical protein
MKTIYQCEYCSFLNINSRVVVEHEETCAFNKDAHKCFTCKHHISDLITINTEGDVIGCDIINKMNIAFSQFWSTPCERWEGK